MSVFTFDKLPSSVEEFKACPYLDLKDAHNTFAMLVVAFEIFVKDQEAGVECINVLRGPVPLSSMDIAQPDCWMFLPCWDLVSNIAS